jgi:hypothetical protein
MCFWNRSHCSWVSTAFMRSSVRSRTCFSFGSVCELCARVFEYGFDFGPLLLGQVELIHQALEPAFPACGRGLRGPPAVDVNSHSAGDEPYQEDAQHGEPDLPLTLNVTFHLRTPIRTWCRARDRKRPDRLQGRPARRLQTPASRCRSRSGSRTSPAARWWPGRK